MASISSIASWLTSFAYASTRRILPVAAATAARAAQAAAIADGAGFGHGIGVAAGVQLGRWLSRLSSPSPSSMVGALCDCRTAGRGFYSRRAIAIKKFLLLPHSNCELACSATCGTRDARLDTVSLEAMRRRAPKGRLGVLSTSGRGQAGMEGNGECWESCRHSKSNLINSTINMRT